MMVCLRSSQANAAAYLLVVSSTSRLFLMNLRSSRQKTQQVQQQSGGQLYTGCTCADHSPHALGCNHRVACAAAGGCMLPVRQHACRSSPIVPSDICC
jgi:hypothetical protein